MSGNFRRGRPVPSVLRGIVLLATGRAAGLLQFGDNAQAFLASLAPLIAFPLVGGLLLLAQGDVRRAVTEVLATVCALLAPAVLSFEPARLWRRTDRWPRFATALNWCQWSIPVLATILLAVVYPLVQSLIPPRLAAYGVIAALAVYALWLHWFIARHGLAISGLRAAGLVAFVNIGTVALVVGPQLLFSGTMEHSG